ncbi:MAG: regulatory signaling modulator protein AmpE [Pseudomonadota bacterium]
MNLIVIIASLLLDRVVDADKAVRCYDFLDSHIANWMERAGDSSWRNIVFFALLLIVPALLAQWVTVLLDDAVFGLLSLLWFIAVVFACLGPMNVDDELESYQRAVAAGESALRDEKFARLTEGTEFASQQDRNVGVLRALFAQVNTHIVAVLFWFIVLGPFGAVLYRVTLYSVNLANRKLDIDEEYTERLELLLGCMTWLPARLVLLAYALAGSFDGTLSNFLGPSSSTPASSLHADNCAVLADAGMSAMDLDDSDEIDMEHLSAARDLIFRGALVLLAGLALMTLAGWFT